MPRRFEAYIAWSALIIRSSAVRPSSGKVTTPIESEVWIRCRRGLDRQLGDPLADLLGQDERAVGLRLGEEDHELVAAVAGRRVDPPDAVADDLADPAQDPIALEVAEPVVDRLEPVEVHHQQAEPPAASGRCAGSRGRVAAKK